MAKKISLHNPARVSLAELENRCDYTFASPGLLLAAVTHSSFTAEDSSSDERNNETLEFLGDAVLDLVISALLIERFPFEREGGLTRMRASLVNERHLAQVAKRLDLGAYLRLGRGEDASFGRRKNSILACAFEALVGAIFADGGYAPVATFVSTMFATYIEDGSDLIGKADYKNLLQELLQARFGSGPQYTVEKEEGPAHDRVFTSAVWFAGKQLGTGLAGSKKEAEKRAAAKALKGLRQDDGADGTGGAM